MASYDYDLFVLGAGSGGVRAGRLSASFGARVMLAEERYLGGTCVNVGCIPKKLLVYASHFSEDFHDAAAGYGWTVGDRSFDWATLIANKDQEIASIISSSEESGARERERLIEEGERLSKMIVEQARVNIDFELKQAREALKAEAAELAIESSNGGPIRLSGGRDL